MQVDFSCKLNKHLRKKRGGWDSSIAVEICIKRHIDKCEVWKKGAQLKTNPASKKVKRNQ